MGRMLWSWCKTAEKTMWIDLFLHPQYTHINSREIKIPILPTVHWQVIHRLSTIVNFFDNMFDGSFYLRVRFFVGRDFFMCVHNCGMVAPAEVFTDFEQGSIC